jgi:hypothetical protein
MVETQPYWFEQSNAADAAAFGSWQRMQFFGRSAADLHRSMTLTTMASPIVLVPGNCYFYCSFYDKALLFPCIQTLQFVSCLEVDDGPLWLFQEPVESFE